MTKCQGTNTWEKVRWVDTKEGLHKPKATSPILVTFLTGIKRWEEL